MYEMIQRMNFEEIVEYTIETYSHENGRDKLHKIYEKVMTSNKLSGLIAESRYRSAPITAMTVMSYINAIPYFIFKSNFTQICAAILFFKRWNDEVNKSTNLLSDFELKQNAIDCITMYNK